MKLNRITGRAILVSVEIDQIWVQLSRDVSFSYPRTRSDRDPRVGSRMRVEYDFSLAQIATVWVDGQVAYAR